MQHNLIYDWNQVDGPELPSNRVLLLNDETLRDGLQSPSVLDPSIERKVEILHLMEDLGISSLNLGLPGAGARAKADVLRLAQEIVTSKMIRNPMVQKWNIAVQQDLGHQMALEVGYQGNHSSHQLFQPDDNPCPNFPTLDSSINCNSLRAYPDIGGISGTASFGVGTYRALTVKLEKHYSSGLQFISSYTYGLAMADTGTTLSGSNNFQTISNLNYNLDMSPAAWNIRHNFTTGITYDLPIGRGKQFGGDMSKAVDLVVGNWQVNGILTLHTGQPYTVSAGGCQGVWAGCFPDVTGDPNAAPAGGRTPSEWFNTANFSAPSALSEGTVGDNRNSGPPLRNLDFSVFKDFPFTERFRMQFRTEVFNLTNTPQFNFPDSGFGDTNFGKVTSTLAGTERHIQFSLKFLF